MARVRVGEVSDSHSPRELGACVDSVLLPIVQRVSVLLPLLYWSSRARESIVFDLSAERRRWTAASSLVCRRGLERVPGSFPSQAAGFVWVLPLTFVSSAFVPTDTMPAAVRAFADVNPVTLCVERSAR